MRLEQKLSQERFAEFVGISVDFLSLIERGTKVPSVETIEQIARRLRPGEFLTLGLIWHHAKCKTRNERFYHMLSNNKREPLLRTLNEIHDRLGYFVTEVFEHDDPESAAYLRSAMGSIKHVVDRVSLHESARSSSA